MQRRPRFDKYYQGEWPYDSSSGVGLALSGAPQDAHRFIDVLQDVSCNPAAARRILDELNAGGTKRTTVMDGLDFNRLGDDLAAVGVKLEIIAPAEPANQELDYATFVLAKGESYDLSKFTPDEQQIVADRVSQLRASLKELPRSFGPYGG